MTLLTEWILLLCIMILGQFSPGPDMILLTRTALRAGLKAGRQMVLGIVTGLSLHAILAIFGISLLLESSPWAEKILSIAAASYLLWLSWQLLKNFRITNSPSLVDSATENSPSPKQNWYLRGLLCNLLNPKVVLFFAGLCSAFLANEHPSWWPALLWITIVGSGTLSWMLWVYILQLSTIRKAYSRYARWFDLGFGIGLALVAMLLCWRLF